MSELCTGTAATARRSLLVGRVGAIIAGANISNTAQPAERDIRRHLRAAFRAGARVHRHQRAMARATAQRAAAIQRLCDAGLTNNQIAQLLHASITDVAGLLDILPPSATVARP